MPPMDEVRQLNQLQRIDLERQVLDEELADIKRRLGDEGDLPKIRGQLARIEAALDDRSTKRRAAEGSVSDLSAKVDGLDKRLYGGSVTNVKELEALREGREFSATRRSEQEDRLLEVMVEIEDLEGARERHVQAIDRLTNARREDAAEMARRQTDLSAQLADLTGEREDARQGLSASLLARYEALRKSRGGRAIATLDGRVCGACRVELPVGELSRAKLGQEVVQCSSCRRIIFAG